MALSKPLGAGYAVADSDRNSLPYKYFCSLCKNILREPLQTNCGHFYCKACYNASQDGNGLFVCLLDQVSLTSTQVYPDNFMKREISSLTLNCPYCCGWSGEVRNRQAHLSKCPKAPVECPNTRCKENVARSDLPQHLEEECSFRRKPCAYCSNMIVQFDIDEHHLKFCESIPVSCPDCGKEIIKRVELEQHQDLIYGDCESTLMDCLFEAVGCQAQKSMKRADAKKHEEICSVFHLSMLLAFCLDLEKKVQSVLSGEIPGIVSAGRDYQSELSEAIAKIDGAVLEANEIRQILEKQNSRIAALESRIDPQRRNSPDPAAAARFSSLTFPSKNGIIPTDIARRLAVLENRIDNREFRICDESHNTNGGGQLMENLVRELESSRETIRRLERRVEATENALAVRHIALADLEEYVKQQETSSHDGVLLWRIDNFSKRKNDAISGRQTSFYSPCFYTSRQGYKMCARIYLNGDGMGRGTHISVFFTVMRGRFDALLRWPFRQKVTIMLLDQDNVEHVIDAFRPDPNSASFQKPRREMNIASGCPLFCSLAELNKHAYVRDDVMFMKIIVDTSDL